MKTFIVIAAFVALAVAKPAEPKVSLSQDTLGNYNLQYETEDASRSEQGFQGGKVIGTFTYTDKEGTVHTINYIASEAGFTAEGDLPQQVQETPEVAAVRAHHLAVVAEKKASLPPLEEEEEKETFEIPAKPAPKDIIPSPPKPKTVDNSAEIAEAKAIHFAAHKEALARLAAAYESIAAHA
ncbi:PREDICTED: uncharacterized protein LOC108569834 [Nicrophorus vespilloides]|uniref:Uncharacterized protein LOC108569834 n=1 Tax=Nicrophorus vespilloides TaxID=110193 RepID=A0ABM1NJN1_NICVS|nr:PREDICTED: uncharacterized protein LOC108569834 [Nicrophorus vespilloides]